MDDYEQGSEKQRFCGNQSVELQIRIMWTKRSRTYPFQMETKHVEARGSCLPPESLRTSTHTPVQKPKMELLTTLSGHIVSPG